MICLWFLFSLNRFSMNQFSFKGHGQVCATTSFAPGVELFSSFSLWLLDTGLIYILIVLIDEFTTMYRLAELKCSA